MVIRPHVERSKGTTMTDFEAQVKGLLKVPAELAERMGREVDR